MISSPSKLFAEATWPMYAAVFVIVFLAGIIHVYCLPHTVVSVLYDSNGYLWTSTELAGFLSRLMRFKPHFEIITNPLFFDNIRHDGLVFPLIYAVYFLLCGKTFLPWQWRQLVFPLICCLAISACLVSYITYKITGSKRWAVTAGLLWGFYPGALAAAERFFTELPAATLCLAYIACLFSLRTSYKRAFVAGALSGATTLIKTALFPGQLVTAVMSAYFAENRKRFVLGFALGLACILAPWAIYAKVASGSFCFTQQRYPVYNASVSFDTESDGWTCLPRTRRQLLFNEFESAGPVLIAGANSDPANSVVLAFKKISRMFNQPWNDFRHNILGMGLTAQLIYHSLLLALAFFGVTFFFIVRRTIADPSEKFGVWLCLTTIAAHLIYLLFQAIPRYAFTAMPFFCILTIYALWALSNSIVTSVSSRRPWSQVITCVFLSIVLTALCQHSESLVSPVQEQALSLKPYQRASVTFEVSEARLPSRNFISFIIVDGDKRILSSSLSFNGHSVQGQLVDPFYYESQGYTYAYTLDQFAAASGLGVGDLRTWRMVQIPSSWLHEGSNVLSLTAGQQGCIIHGDPPNSHYLPRLDHISLDKVLYSFSGDDPRVSTRYTTVNTKLKSWITKGGVVQPLKDKLRLRFMAVLSTPQEQLQKNTNGTEVANELTNAMSMPALPAKTLIDEKLPLSAFDLLERCTNPGVLRINHTTYRLAKEHSVFLAIPDWGAADHLKVTLSGVCRNVGSLPNFGTRISFVPFSNGYPQAALIPAGLPRFIQATKNWSRFQINDIVPTCALNAGKPYLELSFYPGPWLDISGHGQDKHSADVEIKDVHVTLTACSFPDIAHHKRIIY